MPGTRAASGKRRQQTSKRRSKKEQGFRAERESVKFLLFTQGVLYLAGGALPGHFRLLTLMPLAILASVGAFRLLCMLLTYLYEQKHAPAAKPVEPVRPPQPTAVPAKVVATRVA